MLRSSIFFSSANALQFPLLAVATDAFSFNEFVRQRDTDFIISHSNAPYFSEVVRQRVTDFIISRSDAP